MVHRGSGLCHLAPFFINPPTVLAPQNRNPFQVFAFLCLCEGGWRGRRKDVRREKWFFSSFSVNLCSKNIMRVKCLTQPFNQRSENNFDLCVLTHLKDLDTKIQLEVPNPSIKESFQVQSQYLYTAISLPNCHFILRAHGSMSTTNSLPLKRIT